MIHPLLSIQAHTQTFILKYFRLTPYGRYMAKIRNTHQGESCFIIGNGPSLTIEDLEMLHEVTYSFAMSNAKEKVKKIAKYETERVETVLEKIMKQGGNWNE